MEGLVMKIKAAIIAISLASLASTSAVACDEACRKAAAEEKQGVEFPSYLSWSYCDDLRMDFLTSGLRSLENYKNNNFDTRYTGGMRNIASFVKQRQEWLAECDQYLSSTDKGRIFEDAATTEKVFAAMEQVEGELTDLANGVVYTTAIGEDPASVANDKFDDLFKLVDDHKTLMHLKGKYVFR